MVSRSSYMIPLLASAMMANWTQRLDAVDSTFPVTLGGSIGGWLTPKHRRNEKTMKKRRILRRMGMLSRRRNR